MNKPTLPPRPLDYLLNQQSLIYIQLICMPSVSRFWFLRRSLRIYFQQLITNTSKHHQSNLNFRMILVAIVAELLKEYTVVVARVLEHMLQDAPLPFPRRVRFLILRNLPFVSPPHHRLLTI
ncbi:hypothetical protein ACS0TY_002836 [Phlomoides rotata]